MVVFGHMLIATKIAPLNGDRVALYWWRLTILADKIGLLRVIRFGMTAMMMLSIPVLYLLATGNVMLSPLEWC